MKILGGGNARPIMLWGEDTRNSTEVPGSSRGPTEPGKRPVRWVYSVTGKQVLVVDGPDGYPRFALSEPRRTQASIETQAPIENLVV